MGRRNRKSIGRGSRVSPSRLVPTIRALRAANTRSAVTNGTRLLPGQIDERSRWARRFRDLLAGYCSDAGSAENLSEGERALVRTIAQTQLQLELQEARFAQNEDGAAGPKALQNYLRTAGALMRRARVT